MKKLLLIALLSIYCVNIFAADRQIKGVILSGEDKMPLIGASVYVLAEDLKKAGSSLHSLGVITDLDGHFAINIPSGVTKFTCSYVGYENQDVLLRAGKDTYQVILEPSATMLDAVVVTGYQTVERRKLTASIAKLDITDEKIGTVRSIDQALSGQIAGLSATASSGAPGAPMKIRIRGTASLTGTQDPLWVLDGIPMEGTEIPAMEDLKDIDNIYSSSIAGLNPADIASITVLKDAAATAIYGARAANGVIVITTKSGQKGKPNITFSTKLSYSPTIHIDRLNLLNSEEKVGLELDLLRSNYDYRSNKGDVSRIISGYGLMGAYVKDGWEALSTDAQRDINRLRSIHTDWNDILFRDAFNQEYNLSLSGGTEKATYYTSVGYYDEKGNVTGVEANRLNLVAKTSYQINRMLKVGASLFANQRKNKSYLTGYDGFTNPVYFSRRANPYAQLYDENGDYIYNIDIQGKGEGNLQFNIFEERANTSNENTVQSLSAIFDGELRFNDLFKVTTQLGLQSDKRSIEQIADQDTYAMRKDRERSTITYPDGVKRSFLPDGGVHKANENANSQLTWKAMGEFRNQFNDIHELEVMLGTELRRTWAQTLFSAGYGFDRQTLTTKPVVFPKEEHGRLFPLHSKTYVENAYVSAFSTASYSLMNRYTFGATIRFDGSDVFGVSKKYRYLPLYSVSGLWRASKESFLADFEKLDNLSFRVSYGLQGNIDKNTSPFVKGFYQNVELLPGGSEDLINVSSPPNKRLRWEKTQSVNAGFDLSLFNQAISISGDYYRRLGTDLIGMQVLPLETGFSSVNVNWASMRNEGVELNLTSRNIHTKNFIWYTNFNIAYNANKVLRETVPGNLTTPAREGYPVGAIFAYKSAGLDADGYPLFYNKAGEKVTATEFFKLEKSANGSVTTLTAQEQRDLYTYIGSSDPLFSGGFSNTFSIKRFDVSINCIFNLGGYAKTAVSYSPTDYDRGMNVNRDILNRWTPTNTDTSFPVLMNPKDRPLEYNWYSDFGLYNSMDTWVKRTDHIRIQSIRVGYKLPENITRFFRIGSGTLALEGRNLFVFGANYDNFLDPETMANQFAQPIPKSFTFSINLNL